MDIDTPLPFIQRTLNDILERYNYLDALFTDLRNEKDELKRRLIESERKVHTLQSIILEYNNRIQELEIRSVNSSRSHESKISDPSIFSGERKIILPFLVKYRLKFTG